MSDLTRHLALAGTFIILVALSWLTISSGTPELWSPYNLLVLMPSWLGGTLSRSTGVVAGLLFVPLVFCAWCLPLFKGSPIIPIRSLLLLVCTVVLSATNLILGYDDGLRFQGRAYVFGVIAISVTCWIVLATLAGFARRHPMQHWNIGFHTALFAWLAWYSLPALGELA